LSLGELFVKAANELSPDRAEEALEYAVEKKWLMIEREDGYIPS